MRFAGLLIALGFVLICRGFFTAAFWYAEENALPFVLSGGFSVLPGTFERASGMFLLVAGMILLFRSR